ncbi:glycosyltransferase [Hymenobacter lapidiphilus]|uniref:Glycosyltransferase n=1 Tax=Hymenobacter lapidiphilus TaxID=2608003 RepID=A0A7Y7PMK9_9BACT|nr:glycosyltransferase [Hymenobacter lapidiphilus]NVO30397.1 glycosyltransferase [Hymenobacter lapidiphilus]
MSSGWGLLLLAFPALYAGQMLRLRHAWQQLPVPELPPLPAAPAPASGSETPATPRFSVLVAARNEAANLPQLLADLARQRLPADQFEVIIADDHSADDTAALLTAAIDTAVFRLQVVRLAETAEAAVGKKAALQAALQHARAPWVVCTDADCRVGPDWLRAYAVLLDAAGPGEVHFVSGPVLLTGPDALLQHLSGLEFAGLVGTGAAGIAAGTPTMCNGANLAYRRSAFAAVAGYAGNAHLPSGDDEFLLHKLHAAFPGSIRFLKHPAALVRTAGPPTLAALLRQRVRWASKWRHYRHPPSQRLAVLVLLANLAPMAGLVASAWQPALLPGAAAGLGLKLAADCWFLAPVLGFLGRRRWLTYAPLLQLAYAPYALLVGLAGLRGGYEWKGRRAG